MFKLGDIVSPRSDLNRFATVIEEKTEIRDFKFDDLRTFNIKFITRGEHHTAHLAAIRLVRRNAADIARARKNGII
jgi:hypothetical protein